MTKKEYVGISARIPKDVFDKMCKLRDVLELTTNQMCTHAIEDWMEIALQQTPSLTKRLRIARFALSDASEEERIE